MEPDLGGGIRHFLFDILKRNFYFFQRNDRVFHPQQTIKQKKSSPSLLWRTYTHLSYYFTLEKEKEK